MKFTPFFIALFCVLSPSAHARLIDKTVAQVNSDVILQSDLDSFKKNYSLRRELDPYIGLTGFNSQSTQEILEYMVQERLVADKFSATTDEVEEEINNIQKNNHIDRNQLKEVLRSQGVDFAAYKNLMNVSVSKRKLIDRELRPLAAVSDEEVKNVYYTDTAFAERRKVEKLVLSYTMQQMILPNEVTANLASQKLKSGEDFDSVAAELSGRGVETTRLDNLSEENMNPSIRKALTGLKVGESTAKISTGGGYLILKVLEVSAPKDPVFEKEKERIRGTLFQKALVNQLKIWTDKEKSLSYIHIP